MDQAKKITSRVNQDNNRSWLKKKMDKFVGNDKREKMTRDTIDRADRLMKLLKTRRKGKKPGQDTVTKEEKSFLDKYKGVSWYSN